MKAIFEETKKEILRRNGACFGISCQDCPIHIEPYIPNFGYECRGGGQGMYRKIVEELNKVESNG